MVSTVTTMAVPRKNQSSDDKSRLPKLQKAQDSSACAIVKGTAGRWRERERDVVHDDIIDVNQIQQIRFIIRYNGYQVYLQ